jgi:beta-lactam-binding protein with PASTA domain
MEQFPKAGSKVEAAGEISISVKVSKGPLMRELPKIKKKSVNTVAKTLAELGFVVNAEYQYDDEINEDAVIGYKDYKSGDNLESGSTITIIVSKGTENTSEPTTTVTQ